MSITVPIEERDRGSEGLQPRKLLCKTGAWEDSTAFQFHDLSTKQRSIEQLVKPHGCGATSRRWPSRELDKCSPAGGEIGLLVRDANRSRSEYDGVFEPVCGGGDRKYDTEVGIKTFS